MNNLDLRQIISNVNEAKTLLNNLGQKLDLIFDIAQIK
jgi:hypothetical protein